MRTHRVHRLAAACVAVYLSSAVWACSSDDSTGPSNPLFATWRATSFVALDQDFIAQGMTMSVTLRSNGTYSLVVTNDLIGSCTPATSCTETGNYTSTAAQLTIDPGAADEVTFTYSIQGSTLTLTGAIEGNPVTITFTRS